MFAVARICMLIVFLEDLESNGIKNNVSGGDGVSPSSLAMHAGLASQQPSLGSALHPSHYFSTFSGIGMGGECNPYMTILPTVASKFLPHLHFKISYLGFFSSSLLICRPSWWKSSDICYGQFSIITWRHSSACPGQCIQ